MIEKSKNKIALVKYVPYFFGEISRIVSIGFSIFDTSAHDIKNSRIELISFGINQKKWSSVRRHKFLGKIHDFNN